MDVGVLRQPPEKVREPCLHLRRVEREELLELIHDEKRLGVRLPPARCRRERGVAVLEPGELAQCLVSRRQAPGPRACPNLAAVTSLASSPSAAHPYRAARHDSRTQERRLARTRRTDHGQKPARAMPLPQRLDLRLAPEEAAGVLLGEGPQARVRAPLLEPPAATPRLGSARTASSATARSCAECEAIVRRLLQAPAHDPVQRRRDRRDRSTASAASRPGWPPAWRPPSPAGTGASRVSSS